VENNDTVKIGTQIWATKNLDVSTFRNGDSIPEAKTDKEWNQAKEMRKPAWCYYNIDPANGKIYGKLYNWYAVHDKRGLAPEGWHVPSDEEWTTLTNYLGGEIVAGGKLKENRTTHWRSPNTGATNETGFTALPGGYRVFNGPFSSIGREGLWWCSTEHSINWGRSIGNEFTNLFRSDFYENSGFSVRCLRDL